MKKIESKNPSDRSAAYGLGGAAIAATGAEIRQNAVNNVAMTILVGGAIIGAMAGSLGCCIPNSNESSQMCRRMGHSIF